MDNKERDIKDYLHLYLGCEWQWKQYSGGFADGIYGTDLFNCLLLREVALGNGTAKPILRKLISITESEIYDIVSIMLGKSVDFLDITKTEDGDFIVAKYKDTESKLPQYDRIKMEVHLSNIGNPFRIDNVWVYIKGGSNGNSHEIVHNSHEIDRYLLYNGFDIYGLIDDELAIDEATLK